MDEPREASRLPMNSPRALWGLGLVLLAAGVVYRTLGSFREISALVDAPVFSTSATVPEVMALCLVVLLSVNALSVICLVLLVTLPAVSEPHVISRAGSRVRAMLLPARSGAFALGTGAALWIAIVAGLSSSAKWSDQWGAVSGVATLADTFTPSIPDGSITPLGLIVLAIVNVAALYLAVSFWSGLVAGYVPRRIARAGLLGLALIAMSSDLWQEFAGFGPWIGIQGVLRQLPPGLSTTTLFLALALLALAVAVVADARRTGRVPVRRIVAIGFIVVLAYQVASLGVALDFTKSLGAGLLHELEGARAGLSQLPNMTLFLTVQFLTLTPAILLLTRMEEMIQLWPMVRVRGAGTRKWLTILTREALRWSVLVASLPILGLLLAALGQPGAFQDANTHDLATLSYWLVITILQATFLALVLGLLRLLTASRTIWLVAIAVLLITPLLVPTRWVPVGLNHLIMVDTYGPTALLTSALTLVGAIVALGVITHLLLTHRTINPEV